MDNTTLSTLSLSHPKGRPDFGIIDQKSDPSNCSCANDYTLESSTFYTDDSNNEGKKLKLDSVQFILNLDLNDTAKQMGKGNHDGKRQVNLDDYHIVESLNSESSEIIPRKAFDKFHSESLINLGQENEKYSLIVHDMINTELKSLNNIKVENRAITLDPRELSIMNLKNSRHKIDHMRSCSDISLLCKHKSGKYPITDILCDKLVGESMHIPVSRTYSSGYIEDYILLRNSKFLKNGEDFVKAMNINSNFPNKTSVSIDPDRIEIKRVLEGHSVLNCGTGNDKADSFLLNSPSSINGGMNHSVELHESTDINNSETSSKIVKSNNSLSQLMNNGDITNNNCIESLFHDTLDLDGLEIRTDTLESSQHVSANSENDVDPNYARLSGFVFLRDEIDDAETKKKGKILVPDELCAQNMFFLEKLETKNQVTDDEIISEGFDPTISNKVKLDKNDASLKVFEEQVIQKLLETDSLVDHTLQRVPCNVCGRHFSFDRIVRHKHICEQNSQQKEKFKAIKLKQNSMALKSLFYSGLSSQKSEFSTLKKKNEKTTVKLLNKKENKKFTIKKISCNANDANSDSPIESSSPSIGKYLDENSILSAKPKQQNDHSNNSAESLNFKIHASVSDFNSKCDVSKAITKSHDFDCARIVDKSQDIKDLVVDNSSFGSNLGHSKEIQIDSYREIKIKKSNDQIASESLLNSQKNYSLKNKEIFKKVILNKNLIKTNTSSRLRPEERWKSVATETCKYCLRKFAPRSIDQHRRICENIKNRSKNDLAKEFASHVEIRGHLNGIKSNQRKISHNRIFPPRTEKMIDDKIRGSNTIRRKFDPNSNTQGNFLHDHDQPTFSDGCQTSKTSDNDFDFFYIDEEFLKLYGIYDTEDFYRSMGIASGTHYPNNLSKSEKSKNIDTKMTELIQANGVQIDNDGISNSMDNPNFSEELGPEIKCGIQLSTSKSISNSIIDRFNNHKLKKLNYNHMNDKKPSFIRNDQTKNKFREMFIYDSINMPKCCTNSINSSMLDLQNTLGRKSNGFITNKKKFSDQKMNSKYIQNLFQDKNQIPEKTSISSRKVKNLSESNKILCMPKDFYDSNLIKSNKNFINDIIGGLAAAKVVGIPTENQSEVASSKENPFCKQVKNKYLDCDHVAIPQSFRKYFRDIIANDDIIKNEIINIIKNSDISEEKGDINTFLLPKKLDEIESSIYDVNDKRYINHKRSSESKINPTNFNSIDFSNFSHLSSMSVGTNESQNYELPQLKSNNPEVQKKIYSFSGKNSEFFNNNPFDNLMESKCSNVMHIYSSPLKETCVDVENSYCIHVPNSQTQGNGASKITTNLSPITKKSSSSKQLSRYESLSESQGNFNENRNNVTHQTDIIMDEHLPGTVEQSFDPLIFNNDHDRRSLTVDIGKEINSGTVQSMADIVDENLICSHSISSQFKLKDDIKSRKQSCIDYFKDQSNYQKIKNCETFTNSYKNSLINSDYCYKQTHPNRIRRDFGVKNDLVNNYHVDCKLNTKLKMNNHIQKKADMCISDKAFLKKKNYSNDCEKNMLGSSGLSAFKYTDQRNVLTPSHKLNHNEIQPLVLVTDHTHKNCFSDNCSSFAKRINECDNSSQILGNSNVKEVLTKLHEKYQINENLWAQNDITAEKSELKIKIDSLNEGYVKKINHPSEEINHMIKYVDKPLSIRCDRTQVVALNSWNLDLDKTVAPATIHLDDGDDSIKMTNHNNEMKNRLHHESGTPLPTVKVYEDLNIRSYNQANSENFKNSFTENYLIEKSRPNSSDFYRIFQNKDKIQQLNMYEKNKIEKVLEGNNLGEFYNNGKFRIKKLDSDSHLSNKTERNHQFFGDSPHLKFHIKSQFTTYPRDISFSQVKNSFNLPTESKFTYSMPSDQYSLPFGLRLDYHGANNKMKSNYIKTPYINYIANTDKQNYNVNPKSINILTNRNFQSANELSKCKIASLRFGSTKDSNVNLLEKTTKITNNKSVYYNPIRSNNFGVEERNLSEFYSLPNLSRNWPCIFQGKRKDNLLMVSNACMIDDFEINGTKHQQPNAVNSKMGLRYINHPAINMVQSKSVNSDSANYPIKKNFFDNITLNSLKKTIASYNPNISYPNPYSTNQMSNISQLNVPLTRNVGNQLSTGFGRTNKFENGGINTKSDPLRTNITLFATNNSKMESNCSPPILARPDLDMTNRTLKSDHFPEINIVPKYIPPHVYESDFDRRIEYIRYPPSCIG